MLPLLAQSDLDYLSLDFTVTANSKPYAYDLERYKPQNRMGGTEICFRDEAVRRVIYSAASQRAEMDLSDAALSTARD